MACSAQQGEERARDARIGVESEAQTEARVFEALEAEAQARAAQDARDDLFFSTAPPRGLLARVKTLWRGSPR